MTPVQIAYFKHFLFDIGVVKMYVTNYRHRRIKGGPEDDSSGNPESLEQFLQEQPYFRVIMKAFLFEMNSPYGFDFWKDINKKWLNYWRIYEDNMANTKCVTLKGSFSILRQNWDKQRYWKDLETPEETYARMHMEPPVIDDDYGTSHKFKVGYKIKSTISGDIVAVTSINEQEQIYLVSDGEAIDFDKEDYWEVYAVPAREFQKPEEEPEEVALPEPEENEETSLEGFSEVETPIQHGGGRKLKKTKVSVNTRNGGYRITFSSEESENLYNKYEYVKLLTNAETNEIALMFNHNSGCRINIKGRSDSKTKNAVINSREIALHICNFYNKSEEDNYFTLDITAVIRQTNSIIYKLKYEE